MTATDELRRLLDERGVEWHHTSGSLGIPYTWWHSPTMGEVDATEGVDGKLYMVLNLDLTPEQAIEATLGGDLEAENEKLRELVRGLNWHIRTDGLCADCPLGLAPDAPYEVMCDVMIEELGIEVDA